MRGGRGRRVKGKGRQWGIFNRLCTDFIYLKNKEDDITSIKGVAERSSVFASKIFTAISQIHEVPPKVIHINEMPWKELVIYCFENKRSSYAHPRSKSERLGVELYYTSSRSLFNHRTRKLKTIDRIVVSYIYALLEVGVTFCFLSIAFIWYSDGGLAAAHAKALTEWAFLTFRVLARRKKILVSDKDCLALS